MTLLFCDGPIFVTFFAVTVSEGTDTRVAVPGVVLKGEFGGANSV
jgi:hypothetical protein